MATTPARNAFANRGNAGGWGCGRSKSKSASTVIDFLLARKYEAGAHRQCLDWAGGVGIRVRYGAGVGITPPPKLRRLHMWFF